MSGRVGGGGGGGGGVDGWVRDEGRLEGSDVTHHVNIVERTKADDVESTAHSDRRT